jgi:hypothetical protein
MGLVKATVFYKETVKDTANTGYFSTGGITVTRNDLFSASKHMRETGVLELEDLTTGIIHIIPEHQIGFVRAIPVKEEAKADE